MQPMIQSVEYVFFLFNVLFICVYLMYLAFQHISDWRQDTLLEKRRVVFETTIGEQIQIQCYFI